MEDKIKELEYRLEIAELKLQIAELNRQIVALTPTQTITTTPWPQSQLWVQPYYGTGSGVSSGHTFTITDITSNPNIHTTNNVNN